MKSHYNKSSLKKILRYNELSRANLSSTDFFADLEAKIGQIKLGSYDFNLTKRNNFFVLENFVDKIIERKVNKRLRKTYKDNPSNRRSIVKQVITFLNETSDYYVIRTDISKFYESIDRNIILKKIKQDRILTFETIFLVDKILNNPLLPDNGLPRGISISSTLSEIYMRSFDKSIKSIDNVFYYERFVDDVIIFCSTKYTADYISENLEEFLPKGLSINRKKTKTSSYHNLTKNNDFFEYLGYRFEVDILKRNKIMDVKISIADKKIKKIKTRITKSFLSFIRDSNYSLLEKRINFLSSNYVLRGGEKSSLMAGLSYNYIFANQLQSLDDINTFYHKMLHSKNKAFGISLSSKISVNEKSRLMKISFKHRFQNKSLINFDLPDLENIKKCWSDES